MLLKFLVINDFLYFLGCVFSESHDTHAPIIKTLNNSEDEVCSKMCNEEPQCSHWTQMSGMCYLKDEDSFKHYRKFPKKKWISGSKHCQLNGTQLRFYV